MTPSGKNGLIRLVIYMIVGFLFAFLYSYFKKN